MEFFRRGVQNYPQQEIHKEGEKVFRRAGLKGEFMARQTCNRRSIAGTKLGVVRADLQRNMQYANATAL